MKKLWVVLMLLGVVVSMPACNTVKGIGQDVERVGEGMSDALE